MFRLLLKEVYLISLVLFLAIGVSSCKSEQPKLMKAVTQFDTEQERDAHIALMRKDHKDLLKHKRDETMIRGIRTKDNSLKACISCHVPKQHNGKILRHTDPEHFCATCHKYVAAQPDCFQCHVDHPVDDSGGATSSLSQDQLDILHASISTSDALVDNKLSSTDTSTQEKQ